MSLHTNTLVIAPGTWNIDRAGSHVRFNVPNMWGLARVKGTFERFDGSLRVDDDSVDARFSIDASSLDTRNKKRDGHLRSGDFFEVDRYPEIRFEATTVVPSADGLAIAGHLLIRDSRVRLDLPVEIEQDDDRLVIRTSAKVLREDAGLGWNRIGMIGGHADVEVELVLVPEA